MNKKIRILLIASVIFLVSISCNIGSKTADQQELKNEFANDVLQIVPPEKNYEPILITNIDKLTYINTINNPTWTKKIKITSDNQVLVGTEKSIFAQNLEKATPIAEKLFQSQRWEYFNDIDFSNEGALSAIASTHGLKLINLAHPENSKEIQLKVDDKGGFIEPRIVSFSKESSFLALSVYDNNTKKYYLYIVNLKTNEQKKIQSYSEEYISKIAWNPKQDILAVCSFNGDLDIYSGNPLEKIESKKYPDACNIDWSHDGKKLAIALMGSKTVDIFDIAAHNYSSIEFSTPFIEFVKWSNDDKKLGSLFSALSVSHLQIYDFTNKSVIFNKVFDGEREEYSNFQNFDWSIDNTDEIIISPMPDSKGLGSYNFKENKFTPITYYPAVSPFIKDFYISADSSELFPKFDNMNFIQVWDINGEKMKDIIQFPVDDVFVNYDEDTNRFAMGSSRDNFGVTWKMYNLENKTAEDLPFLDGSHLLWFDKDQYLTCCFQKWEFGKRKSAIDISENTIRWDKGAPVKVSKDNRYLAVMSFDRNNTFKLDVFEMASLKLINSISDIGQNVAYYSWNPTNNLLLTSGDDRVIRIWDIDGTQKMVSIIFEYPMFAPEWSPDGQMIASVSKDGMLYILRANDLTIIKKINLATAQIDEYNRQNPRIKWSPNNKFLYLLSDGSLDIYGIK